MKIDSSLLAGCFGDTIWVRVEGKGTFQNSPGLKDFSRNMVGRGYHKFVIDLVSCDLMDSTFMGTLAGIALRLREFGQGNLSVINANIRNASLLVNLGLDHLFEVKTSGDPTIPSPPEISSLKSTSVDSASSEEQRAVIREAHEALIRADSQNLAKFRDILEYLDEERTGCRGEERKRHGDSGSGKRAE